MINEARHRNFRVTTQAAVVRSTVEPLGEQSLDFLNRGFLALSNLTPGERARSYHQVRRSLTRRVTDPIYGERATKAIEAFARHGVPEAEIDIADSRTRQSVDNSYSSILALGKCERVGMQQLMLVAKFERYANYRPTAVRALCSYFENFPNASLGLRERRELNNFVNSQLAEAIKEQRLDRLENLIKLVGLTDKIDPVRFYKTAAAGLPEVCKNAWFWDDDCSQASFAKVLARCMSAIKSENEGLNEDRTLDRLTTRYQSLLPRPRNLADKI